MRILSLVVPMFTAVLASGCSPGGAITQAGSSDFGATAGGTQDMGLARELIEAGYVPAAGAFVVEGMFSEHDLPLAGAPCTTMLCLRAAPGLAPTLDGVDRGWTQVGMSSTIDPTTFVRPSQTIVAVVDISGSMGWEGLSGAAGSSSPGGLARSLLRAIGDELGPNDKVAMVTYGSLTATPLNFVDGDSDRFSIEVGKLDEGGSTNMEAGLERGFQLARNANHDTDLRRVMLFTDVQPNIGITGASEFEEMADEAAADGVGLTVFALGQGMGHEVMLGMSHLQGGNAFSLFEPTDVDDLMDDSWPWMVSPIAYDLSMEVTAAGGFDLQHAYGFPPSTGQSGKLLAELDVATVFLSNRKGALLLEFGADGSVPFEQFTVSADLTYTDVNGDTVNETLDVAVQAGSELDQDGHWYQQEATGRTVALAVLVDGMNRAATHYGTNPVLAVDVMADVVDRATEDATRLQNTAFDAELALAQQLRLLMDANAEQVENLYGY